jgi:emp24/gp25L/p24 family/GOLD
MYDKKGLAKGQFAFTTKEDGDYKACFTAKGAARHRRINCSASMQARAS